MILFDRFPSKPKQAAYARTTFRDPMGSSSDSDMYDPCEEATSEVPPQMDITRGGDVEKNPGPPKLFKKPEFEGAYE